MSQSLDKKKKLLLGLAIVIVAVAFFLVGYFVGQTGNGRMMRDEFPNGQFQGRGRAPEGMMDRTASGTPPMQIPQQDTPVR